MSLKTQKPDASLIIRHLNADDCTVISNAFYDQGWIKPVEQFQKYFAETEAGSRVVYVAELEGEFAGYLTIVWKSDYLPFRELNIPEIVDFNVLIKYQQRGIGNKLMDAAEAKISSSSPIAGIGVGLTPDYGAAQVLYVRRGYIPDGRGVLSHGKFIHYGDTITVDDDMALYFTKDLKAG